ncbi:MAG: CoA-binding protein [Alphaproteobacteria bacterium]|nr:CoA-binding protein [Alphaproteobacteria bacterium]
MPEWTREPDLRRVLTEARTVAVLGAHPDTSRPAFYVPDYLHSQGYRILPVNARYVGKTLWGEPVRASLAELAQPVDVVDVFRRSEAIPGHLEEILAMRPLPGVVWLQRGIRNDAAAERLLEAGIDVVQDRCMLADHKAFGIGPR